jgi:uncharacterized protein YaaN involved in tellurite resistance
MTQTQVLAPVTSTFVLTPPEVVEPVAPAATTGIVPLPDALKAKMQTQVDGFVSIFLQDNVQSDAFREKLDQSFSVGRAEIAAATALSNAFTKKNFVGELDSPAYKAISEMRTLFDDLNPARQGNLFTPKKVFGIPVPFGNKLTSYLRRYESAGKQIDSLYQHIQEAKVDVEKCVSELGNVRTKLYENIQKLEAVVYFVNELDNRVAVEIETLKSTDAGRARALEQEVLYYVRQNLGDVQATQALTINAYNVAGQLRGTGREVINGCDRVATLGMAALSVAVTLARATGVQLKTMEMLVASKKSIEDLIVASGEGLQNHVKATTDFASNPLFGVQTLQQMFSMTDAAMEMMANFRSTTLVTMKGNNEMVQGMVANQMLRISNERKALGVTA